MLTLRCTLYLITEIEYTFMLLVDMEWLHETVEALSLNDVFTNFYTLEMC